MTWDAERFEEMLRALLRGEVDIEDVCGDIDRNHTYTEAGVLTKDHRIDGRALALQGS